MDLALWAPSVTSTAGIQSETTLFWTSFCSGFIHYFSANTGIPVIQAGNCNNGY